MKKNIEEIDLDRIDDLDGIDDQSMTAGFDPVDVERLLWS